MTDPPPLGMRTAILVICMGCLAALSWSTISSNVPTALAPYSFAVVILVFEGGSAFAVTVMPLLFLLWSVNLVDGRPALPVRSVVLMGAICVGVVVWFLVGWSDGLIHQGVNVVVLWVLVNAALFALMTIMAFRFRARASWWRTLLFQWMLFAWPAWCGFPWLGEGI